MLTINSAMLLNEVKFYRSQQHLLHFRKSYHKHGKAFYLFSLKSVLGALGTETADLELWMEAFPRTSQLTFLRSPQAMVTNTINSFYHPYFLEHDVLLYPLNTEVSHNTRECIPYLVAMPLSGYETGFKLRSQWSSSRPFKTKPHPLPKQIQLPLPQKAFVKIKQGHRRSTCGEQKPLNNTTFCPYKCP